MTLRWRAVDLDGARPEGNVVVIDVLRAFTFQAWAFERGARRILAVDGAEHALVLARTHLPDALVAGERGGRPLEGYDLGNSPVAIAEQDLSGRTIVHRTSAGTQGLTRTEGADLVVAASFVTASATARFLHARGVDDVTFVVTGDSLGRDGDEDLACAELIAARLAGDDPDPEPYVARVALSDAGRLFTPEGPDWASPEDMALACEVDRFDFALEASPAVGLAAVEVQRRPVG